MRAFTDSIALVVHTIRRISRSKPRNGTNSAHAFSHSRMIAGYLALQAWANSRNSSSASATVAAWQTGFSPREKGVPVLAGGVLEAVPHQVHDAGLHDGVLPHRVHRIGQTSQTTMSTSWTPRFLISVRTCSQYFAPSPPSPAHRPRMSRFPRS